MLDTMTGQFVDLAKQQLTEHEVLSQKLHSEGVSYAEAAVQHADLTRLHKQQHTNLRYQSHTYSYTQGSRFAILKS